MSMVFYKGNHCGHILMYLYCEERHNLYFSISLIHRMWYVLKIDVPTGSALVLCTLCIRMGAAKFGDNCARRWSPFHMQCCYKTNTDYWGTELIDNSAVSAAGMLFVVLFTVGWNYILMRKCDIRTWDYYYSVRGAGKEYADCKQTPTEITKLTENFRICDY